MCPTKEAVSHLNKKHIRTYVHTKNLLVSATADSPDEHVKHTRTYVRTYTVDLPRAVWQYSAHTILHIPMYVHTYVCVLSMDAYVHTYVCVCVHNTCIVNDATYFVHLVSLSGDVVEMAKCSLAKSFNIPDTERCQYNE